MIRIKYSIYSLCCIALSLGALGCAGSPLRTLASKGGPVNSTGSDVGDRAQLEFLTEAQKKTILSEVDSVCGDTWCEGDYNYRFNLIACDSAAKACILKFDMIEDGESDLSFKPVSQTGKFISKISNTHSVSCTVNGLSKVDDLLETIRPDYHELKDGFYSPLNDCIATLEKKLR